MRHKRTLVHIQCNLRGRKNVKFDCRKNKWQSRCLKISPDAPAGCADLAAFRQEKMNAVCKKGPRANTLGLSPPCSAVPQHDRTRKEENRIEPHSSCHAVRYKFELTPRSGYAVQSLLLRHPSLK